MGEYLDSKQFMVAWLYIGDANIQQQQVEGLHRMHALVQSEQPFITLEDTHKVPYWDDLMLLAIKRSGFISVKEIV